MRLVGLSHTSERNCCGIFVEWAFVSTVLYSKDLLALLRKCRGFAKGREVLY